MSDIWQIIPWFEITNTDLLPKGDIALGWCALRRYPIIVVHGKGGIVPLDMDAEAELTHWTYSPSGPDDEFVGPSNKLETSR